MSLNEWIKAVRWFIVADTATHVEKTRAKKLRNLYEKLLFPISGSI